MRTRRRSKRTRRIGGSNSSSSSSSTLVRRSLRTPRPSRQPTEASEIGLEETSRRSRKREKSSNRGRRSSSVGTPSTRQEDKKMRSSSVGAKPVNVTIDISSMIPEDDPIEFAESVLEHISREFVAGLHPTVVKLAKKLVVDAVRIYYESELALEEDGNRKVTNTGLDRTKFQKDYITEKAKHFAEAGVKAALKVFIQEYESKLPEKISVDDLLKQELRTETWFRQLMLTNQKSNKPVCHAAQAGAVEGAFQTMSEVRSELMPRVLTDPILHTLFTSVQSTSGEIMDTLFNKDHGFFTRTESLVRKTVSLRMALILCGVFPQILKSGPCMRRIEKIVKDLGLLPDFDPENPGLITVRQQMENEVIQGSRVVIGWTQKLAIAVLLKNSENVPIPSAMTFAREGVNPEKVLQRAAGTQSASQVIRQKITGSFLIHHLSRDKSDDVAEIVSGIDPKNGAKINPRYVSLVFDRRVKTPLKAIHRTEGDTYTDAFKEMTTELHEELDALYAEEKQKLEDSRLPERYREAAEENANRGVWSIAERHAHVAPLLKLNPLGTLRSFPRGRGYTPNEDVGGGGGGGGGIYMQNEDAGLQTPYARSCLNNPESCEPSSQSSEPNTQEREEVLAAKTRGRERRRAQDLLKLAAGYKLTNT